MRKKIKVTICLRLIKYLLISRAFTVICQTTVVTEQSWCSAVQGTEKPSQQVTVQQLVAVQNAVGTIHCCFAQRLQSVPGFSVSRFLRKSYQLIQALTELWYCTLEQLPVSTFIVHKMFNWSLGKGARTDNRVRLLSQGHVRNYISQAYRFDLLDSKCIYAYVYIYTYSMIYLILNACL